MNSIFKSLMIPALICLSITGHCQEITIFPGFFGYEFYQDQTRLGKGEIKELMAHDAVTNQLWQRSRSQEAASWVFLGIETGALMWWAASPPESYEGVLIVTSAAALASIGFMLSATKLKKRAVLRYNSMLPDEITWEIGPTDHGIGLLVKF